MRHCLVVMLFILPSSLWAISENSAIPTPAVTLDPNTSAPISPPRDSTNRGQLLYEHHCTSCHTSVAHLREHRKAQNRVDITAWATKWAVYQKLSWSPDEISAVVDYLDATFYKFSPDK